MVGGTFYFDCVVLGRYILFIYILRLINCLLDIYKFASNLEIKRNSKIVIDCYNKRINIHSSIMLLIEDI